jgi:hypothetical protein
VAVVGENLSERERAIRARNRALAAVLVALVVLFYIIAVVRLGGS